MTDKELIQAFRECMKPAACRDCPRAYRGDSCNIESFEPTALVERLDALLAENERLNIELQAMRNAANAYKLMVPKWVRVEERLPEHAGDYLVVLAGTLEMAVLDFDTLPRSWTDGDGVEYAVTHWMPTPLRPEEDKKDG